MQYEIIGGTLPVVTCHLQSGEAMITERGSMSWMTPNMVMETSSGGGLGKALGRMFAGDSIFQNRYTAQGGPGSIRALEIAPGREMIVQKAGFLASEASVSLSVHIQHKFSAGLFGGEGFIMQRLSGRGIAFLEIDGTAVEFDLAPGQSMIVDSGYLAAMDATVDLDIEQVRGAKNVFFGGEGLFNTRLTGPGKIILQSMPISAVAGSLLPYIPTKS